MKNRKGKQTSTLRKKATLSKYLLYKLTQRRPYIIIMADLAFHADSIKQVLRGAEGD